MPLNHTDVCMMRTIFVVRWYVSLVWQNNLILKTPIPDKSNRLAPRKLLRRGARQQSKTSLGEKLVALQSIWEKLISTSMEVTVKDFRERFECGVKCKMMRALASYAFL